MPWKPCPDKCSGVVRQFKDQICQECGYSEAPPATAPTCTETISLFGDEPTPTPPHNGTDTSREAAASLTPDTLREQHRKILRALYRAPDGLTDQELEILTGMGGSTVRPRRQELEREGWIEQRVQGAGAVTRETASGRKAVVWYGSPRLASFVQQYQQKLRGAA